MTTSQTVLQPIVLVLGSRNRKKCNEMAELIAPPWEGPSWSGLLEIRSIDDFPDAPEVVEDAASFVGNARKKASELARALGHWVLADDSGLTVDALNGAPGVISARYAGEPCDDAANNCKLLDALAEIPDGQRGAAFVLRTGPCRLVRSDPARGRRLLPRHDHSRPARSRRLRLRPAFPDRRVPSHLRRTESSGQAPAQSPQPSLRSTSAWPEAADQRYGNRRRVAVCEVVIAEWPGRETSPQIRRSGLPLTFESLAPRARRVDCHSSSKARGVAQKCEQRGPASLSSQH